MTEPEDKVNLYEARGAVRAEWLMAKFDEELQLAFDTAWSQVGTCSTFEETNRAAEDLERVCSPAGLRSLFPGLRG